MKLLEKIPDDAYTINACHQISESYGPFGKEKVKLLDNSFDMIMENMFCGGGIKQMLYVVDKKLPSSKAEFDSYIKLKKFQQYEQYPDPIVRSFIETQIAFNLTTDQYNNFLKNHLKILKVIKTEMTDGVSQLFSAKQQIYKSLMLLDLFKSNFVAASMTKKQLLNAIDNIRHNELKVSYQQLFNIQKKEIDVETRIDIPDPKTHAKFHLECPDMPKKKELAEYVTRTYHTTIQT
jgi:hypothetical protein